MIQMLLGDCRETMRTLPAGSVHTCVTSPPYWGLRDYGVAGQMGLETTPDAYVANLVEVFREVKRVLRDDGTLWLNLGDSYASDFKGSGGPSEKQLSNAGSWYESKKMNHGVKPKDLVGIPWMVAFALRADGWYLRSDIIWHKPNPMPESIRDRPTKAHEYLFLLSKSQKYFYDVDVIREPHVWAKDPQNDGKRHTYAANAKHNQVDPDRQRTKTDCVSFHPLGRNKRTVWTVATRPFRGAHFATFPSALIEPCIKAGCPVGGTVLDPFGGAGTTGLVSDQLGRNAILCELNPEYIDIAKKRLSADKDTS